MRTSSRPSSTVPMPGAVLAYDIEAIAPPTDDGSFPPWPTHRPVALGLAQAEQRAGSWHFALDALVIGGDVDEVRLLREADQRIREYVLEDAVATLVFYLVWTAARAADEALTTRPLAALARHVEALPELTHLQPFVDCALTRWARPRAMKAELGAALARAIAKLAREEEERAFASS